MGSTSPVDDLIRPDVASLKYSPVQSLESIAQEVGLRVEELIKMDANENAYGTPEEVKQAIVEAFSKLHIYPGSAHFSFVLVFSFDKVFFSVINFILRLTMMAHCCAV